MSVYSITRFRVLTSFLRHKLGKHFLLNVNVTPLWTFAALFFVGKTCELDLL